MMRCGGTAVDELQRLLLELRRFTRARDWERYHDPKNLAMALASEAGELCDVLRWVDNAEADRFARDPRHRARIAEEAADVGLLLLMLCDRVGIDLPEAMHAKLRRNREKYPAEQWRGKAWADAPAPPPPPPAPAARRGGAGRWGGGPPTAPVR
jgi:NTP pyrophosphatase (non-canonical NTP hydrolase)